MFYLIGLGLGDPKDITVKGLEIVKQCTRVYLEMYTSILGCPKEELVSTYVKHIILTYGFQLANIFFQIGDILWSSNIACRSRPC